MGTQDKKRLPGCLRRAGWATALLAAAGSVQGADVPRFVAPFPSTAFSVPAPTLVTLVWFDVQDQLPGGFETMAAEVRSIFAEIGVVVAVRMAGPGDTFGADSSREIAVIALAEDPSPKRRKQSILGLVVRDQQPTRAIWAFLANLRRTLGFGSRASDTISPTASDLLARAVGRVVAHEVVHAVAPDHPHDGAGLMKHALSRSLLLGPRQPFGPDCAHSVLAALDPPPTRERDVSGPAELSVAIP